MSRYARAPRQSASQGLIDLQLPSIASLDPPGRKERGTIKVLPAGKAPKLRFAPGSFIEYQGKLYEIMFAYRVAAKPSRVALLLRTTAVADFWRTEQLVPGPHRSSGRWQ